MEVSCGEERWLESEQHEGTITSQFLSFSEMFNVEGNGFESFFEHLKVGLIELFGFHLVFTEVKMYCMNCGVVLAEWAFYCPGCGTPVPRQQGVVPAQVQANGS